MDLRPGNGAWGVGWTGPRRKRRREHRMPGLREGRSVWSIAWGTQRAPVCTWSKTHLTVGLDAPQPSVEFSLQRTSTLLLHTHSSCQSRHRTTQPRTSAHRMVIVVPLAVCGLTWGSAPGAAMRVSDVVTGTPRFLTNQHTAYAIHVSGMCAYITFARGVHTVARCAVLGGGGP